MTAADPARSPAGTESAWSYSHLPRGVTDDEAARYLAARMDAVLEAHAPGVSDLIVERHVQTPRDLQSADANLVGGAVNGGTSQLFQQLVFRPTPGLGGAITPVGRLYLAGSSARRAAASTARAGTTPHVRHSHTTDCADYPGGR